GVAVDQVEYKADDGQHGGQRRERESGRFFHEGSLPLSGLFAHGGADVHGGTGQRQQSKGDLHTGQGVVVPGTDADQAAGGGQAVHGVGVGQGVVLPQHGLLEGGHQGGILADVLDRPVGPLLADGFHG